MVFVIRRCKCGSTEFSIEDDTWRCDDCGRLADFSIKEKNNKNKENNESLGEKNG